MGNQQIGNLRCYIGGTSLPVYNKKTEKTESIDIQSFELIRFKYSMDQMVIDGPSLKRIVGSMRFRMMRNSGFTGEIIMPEKNIRFSNNHSVSFNALNQRLVYVSKKASLLQASFETFGLDKESETQKLNEGFRSHCYNKYVSKTIPGLYFLDLDSETVTEDEKIKREAIEILAEKVRLQAKRIRLDSEIQRISFAYAERDPEGYLEKLHTETKARMMAA